MKRWFIGILVLALVAVVFPGAVRAEEAEGDADDIGLFGGMRAKILARQFDLDTATALRLTTIQREDGMQKKRLNDEIKELHAELGLAIRNQADARPIATLFDELHARRTALADVENATIDRVAELIGEVGAARWLLARRGMMERVTGNVRRVGRRDQRPAPAAAPQRPARQRRGGSY